jgi:hypothetical protein
MTVGDGGTCSREAGKTHDARVLMLGNGSLKVTGVDL